MVSGKDLLDLATAAARHAGSFLQSVDRPSHAAWDRKGASDFVTDVDRATERLIAEILADAKGTVVGEELSPRLVRDGLVWIVDPLDGTTNYLHDFPSWSVSIAAALDGVLLAGVVYDVPGERLHTAHRDGGAACNGHPIAVSSIREPSLALIGTGFPFKNLELLPTYQEQFARVIRSTSGVRRTGSAAIDLALTAAGGLDAFWELHLAPWDIAAGLLLVREAGGIATDLGGRDVDLGHGPVVAGNPSIQPWLLAQLAPTELPADATPVGGPS